MACIGFLMLGEILNSWELMGVFVGATMMAEIKSTKGLWWGTFLATSAHINMAVGILMAGDIYREISVFWVSNCRFSIAVVAMFILAWIKYPNSPNKK